jgi:hypothetical protein
MDEQGTSRKGGVQNPKRPDFFYKIFDYSKHCRIFAKHTPIRGCFCGKHYKMDTITIKGKTYYSMDRFKELGNIKSHKTVYNMVKDDRVEQTKVFNKSFFRLKDA